MGEITTLLWHVPLVMGVLLTAGLIMGQRHVGELSVFDLLTGIAIGAVAGAGIVDTQIPFLPMLVSIFGLAILHFAITWLMKKSAWFGRMVTFEPLVVVRDGKPLREAMRKVRLTLGDLFPLLREKDVFDLREVSYAILEPDGKLTVVKKPVETSAVGLPRVVCADGQVERGVLQSAGWDEGRLRRELSKQGISDLKDTFVATLDDAGNLYALPKAPDGKVPEIQH